MENKNIMIAVGILVLIVVGMFVFAYIKKSELAEEQTTVTPVVDQRDVPYADITRVDAKHFFINGEHTLVGEILMPTQCDLLSWSTQVAESMPEQVTVAFDIVNHSEVCTQVITPQRFKVEFSASENASIRATLEARHVDLNLVPALSGESPDDFELFIKG